MNLLEVSIALLFVLLLGGFVVIAMLIRRSLNVTTPPDARIDLLIEGLNRNERTVREEFSRSRDEARNGERLQRDELATALKDVAAVLKDELARSRDESQSTAKAFGEYLFKIITDHAAHQRTTLDAFRTHLSSIAETMERGLREGRSEQAESLKRIQEQVTLAAKIQRDEFAAGRQGSTDELVKFRQSNEAASEALRSKVDLRLAEIRTDNDAKLEQMRATVEEKLQGTLEKRLGESFTQVAERLEQVHKGLGEMQSLALGVGDLKRVLSNVTTRGHWGEVHLEALLEQILAPDQYARQVRLNDETGEAVDFAIKLWGGEDGSDAVWLPIDSKFPTEDYERLLEAQQRADAEAADAAAKMLMDRIRAAAKSICRKYILPPKTTDFAIMFLPTEGLYAEVMRRTGFFEVVRRECSVMIVGPTNLAAFLSSLRMGFRSQAIQKRSVEVRQLLGAVKSEFGRFGDVIGGVRKKLEQAARKIDAAEVRSRAIHKSLQSVEALPISEAKQLLPELNVLESEASSESSIETE